MMNEPNFQRIHPLTILIEAWRAVSRFLFVIVIFLFSWFTGARGGDTMELIFSGLGVFAVIAGVFRYLTFKFAIHQGNLVIKQGFVTKQDRVIPISRIQNINLKRDLLHRILGLVDLEVETAAGAKAEAVISAVTEDQAHMIKQQLLGSYQASASAVVEQRREEVVYTATPKELFWAGATENKIFVIIASVAGLFGVSQQAIAKLIENAMERLSKDGLYGATMGWGLYALLVVGALFIGWCASIIMAFITYWGFEVAYRDGRFRRSYGLLNNYENVLPLKRVQVVRMTDNILQRWIGFCKLYMETAGAFSEKDNEGRNSARPTPLMAPFIYPDAALKLIQRVMPGVSLDPSNWSKISSQAIWGRLIGALPYVVVATGIAAYYFQWWAVAVFFGTCILVWALAYAQVRNTRWHVDGERVILREGNLWRSHSIIPIAKIQRVDLEQTMIQRKMGLSSLSLMTAAAGGKSQVVVRDIPQDLAGELALKLHKASGQDAWRHPDGF